MPFALSSFARLHPFLVFFFFFFVITLQVLPPKALVLALVERVFGFGTNSCSNISERLDL